MSGFSGGSGMGQAVRNLAAQVQDQNGGVQPSPPQQTTPAVQPVPPGAGDPASQAQGKYNALAQDMSQGRIAPHSFANNRFSYSPGGKGMGSGGIQPQGFGFGRGMAGGFGSTLPVQQSNPLAQPMGGMNTMFQQQNPYSNYRPLPFGSIRPQIHMANPYGYGNDYSEGSYNAMNMANTARWR